MKPQKEVTFSVALLFLAQNVFFPHGAQAQSSPGGQIVGAVGGVLSQMPGMYSQDPMSPNFMTNNLAAEMSKCTAEGALGITGNSIADANNLEALTTKWADKLGKKKDGETSSGDKCKADCSQLKADIMDLAEDPSCSTYAFDIGAQAGEIITKKAKPNAGKRLDREKSAIQEYVSCLKGKQNCADSEKALLDKQIAAFNCQMGVLQRAVQDASQQLQMTLQQTQKVYADMNGHQKEVGEQMQQVDEILGPDPELGKSGASQFQGLLGLQKELNDNLPKMVEAETKFKTDIEQLKNETRTNEQNLEAARVNVASQCIKGSRNIGVSGGYSLTCFKPVMTQGKDGSSTASTDRNGNVRYSKQPCGPYDYIRSKIEQKAFITNRGILMTQDRREKSAENAAAFDSLVDSINRAMGDYDGKGSDNARLDVSVHNWSDIENKIGSNIDAVSSQSGVDVRSMLRSVAGHCFQEADSYRNQQIRSSSSDYSRKKAELKKMQTNMTSQMDSGITSMNKTYGDIMAVLFDKHVTLSRAQCTKDNPEMMASCFAKIRQNVQNLLEGNGELTTTAKRIKGGPTTPAFSVSCRGLNGCVTAFKNVRDQQKSYMRDVQKRKEEFVKNSNQATQMKLQGLTQQLSGLQNSLLAQYDAMKVTMGKMGVSPPDRPKFMEGEQLSPSEGPDKTMGPFNNPKSMASVLFGMMQPGGMVNFSDTGLREVQHEIAEKAKEKKDKAAEELKTYTTMAKKYNNIENECGISGLGSGEDLERVGQFTETCDECVTLANSCQKSEKSGVTARNPYSDLTPEETKKKLQEAKDLQAKLQKKKKDTPKKFTASDQTALDQAILDVQILTENLKNGDKKIADDNFQQNMKTLQDMIDVFSKMADKETLGKEGYQKLNRENMSVLYSLDQSKGCAGIYDQCKTCTKLGKGAYTEDGKLKTATSKKAN